MFESFFPFLSCYIESINVFSCEAFCIDIYFFIFWSVGLSSSPVQFNKGPEYLTRNTANACI